MDEAFESVFHEELTAARNAGRQDGIAIGEERGLQEGRREGILKTLSGLIHKGILSLKDAALEANMTEDEFTAQMAALGY